MFRWYLLFSPYALIAVCSFDCFYIWLLTKTVTVWFMCSLLQIIHCLEALTRQNSAKSVNITHRDLLASPYGRSVLIVSQSPYNLWGTNLLNEYEGNVVDCKTFKTFISEAEISYKSISSEIIFASISIFLINLFFNVSFGCGERNLWQGRSL